MKTASPFMRLMRYAAPHRTKMILATICSIINMLFDILPEVLIGVAVNVVVKKQNSVIAHFGFPGIHEQLIILGIITFIVWLLESAFEYAYSILWRNLGQVMQHELRLDAYEHIQQLDMAYYENVSSGRLMTILNDDINQLERFLDKDINKFLQLCTSTIAILCIFFYLSPMITLYILIPVPFIFLTARWFQNHLSPRYKKVRECAGTLAKRIVNNINGTVTIKSYTAQEYEFRHITHDSREYKLANKHVIAMGSAITPIVRIILALGFIATMVIGGMQVISGQLDVGAYSLLVFQTQRFLWPFTDLAEMIDNYARAMASAQRVFDLLDIPIAIYGGHERLNPAQVKGHIEFDNVSFVYPNGVKIFHHLSLEVMPGKTAAFVGTTGAGKSTLIKLLLRFYDPTKGTIFLDSVDIRTLDLHDLRKAIGLVSQDVFLFDGTILENIAYADETPDLEAVMNAAKVAEAHEFITNLPQGYDTLIGERGSLLSGGQRQRISIARAFYKNPPIFIFDEATSAVDTETEAAIQRSLEKMIQGHTVLVIAHRLSTIRRADIIFVMQ